MTKDESATFYSYRSEKASFNFGSGNERQYFVSLHFYST